MQIAEKIALGEMQKIEGQLIIPSFSDRLKALDYLSKVEGDYAAAKIEQTINEIKPLEPKWSSQDFSKKKDADNS